MVDESLIESLEQCGAIQFGHFILTSGKESKYYIDIKKASTKPKILREIAQKLIHYTNGCDIIAGMELGAVPLAVALSLESDLPYVIIRKEKRAHGTGKQVEGENIKDKTVLLVEDVTTSGGSVVKSIDIIQKGGGTVKRVVTVVDREGQAKNKIMKLQIEFHSLLTVSDILKK